MSHVCTVYLSTQTPAVQARMTSPLLWCCVGATCPVRHDTDKNKNYASCTGIFTWMKLKIYFNILLYIKICDIICMYIKIIYILPADWNAFTDVPGSRFQLQNVLPMCHKNKHCVMITETRTHATEVEQVLWWIFPTESFYTTSYLIFSRLLSTDSSRTSWGKRTIILCWSPCKNTTTVNVQHR